MSERLILERKWEKFSENEFELSDGFREDVLAKTRNIFEIASVITRKTEVNLYGGTVRNLFLGIETSMSDYDFIGDFDLDQIQNDFPSLVVGRWDKFNTLRLKVGQHSFDFTTTKNIKERLRLTDMNISTLVLNKTGIVTDYFNGLRSLSEREIKMDESEFKIATDPSRILRAFRFAAELEFTIEKDTLAAIIKQAPLLIEAASLDDEVWQILALDEPVRKKILQALDQYGISRYLRISENVMAAIDEYSLVKDIQRIPQVNEVARMFESVEIYLGGGAVRDLIWSKKINDLDFEVNLPLEGIISTLEANGYRRIEGYQTSEHQYYISTFAGVVGAVVNGVDVHFLVMTDGKVSTLLREGDVNFSCCVFNIKTGKVENPEIIREIKEKRLHFCDVEHARTDPLIVVNALKQISRVPEIVVPSETKSVIESCIPDVVLYFREHPEMKYKLASICGNLNSEKALTFFNQVSECDDIFGGIEMKKPKLCVLGDQYYSKTVEELSGVDRVEIIQLIRSAFGTKYKPEKEFPDKINSVVFERQNGHIVACCLIDGERVYVASARGGHDWINIFNNLVQNNYNVWCTVDCDNPKVQALCTLGGLSLETEKDIMRSILVTKGGKKADDLDIFEHNGMLVFEDKKKHGYAQVLLRC